jgi:hypothetical protein
MLKMTLALTFSGLSILIILKPVLIKDIPVSWSNKKNQPTNPLEMLGNFVPQLVKSQLIGLPKFKPP